MTEKRANLDVQTTYSLLSSHGCVEELLFFARLIEDYDRVLSHHIQREDIESAIFILKEVPIEKAEALMATTPVSTLYALYGVLSQCSPGLLPTTVEGSPELWTIRMTEFYELESVRVVRRRCFNPSKRSRVPSLLEQWQGQEAVFEKACLKNYGVDRVLSRDIFYPSFSTMAREAGDSSLHLSSDRH